MQTQGTGRGGYTIRHYANQAAVAGAEAPAPECPRAHHQPAAGAPPQPPRRHQLGRARQAALHEPRLRQVHSPSILTSILFAGNRKPPPASITYGLQLSQLEMETTCLNVCEAKICWRFFKML